jgi:hypothetical protein
VIPSSNYGWEVDLQKAHRTTRVFIPNTCGNLSYVNVPKRFRVAAAHYRVPPWRTPVAALPRAVSTPAPAAVATAVPTPEVTPAPVAIVSPPAAAPASHHLGWLPLLVIPLIAGLSIHGGSRSSAAPAPLHTICPTAVIR